MVKSIELHLIKTYITGSQELPVRGYPCAGNVRSVVPFCDRTHALMKYLRCHLADASIWINSYHGSLSVMVSRCKDIFIIRTEADMARPHAVNGTEIYKF